LLLVDSRTRNLVGVARLPDQFEGVALHTIQRCSLETCAPNAAKPSVTARTSGSSVLPETDANMRNRRAS
jgi:hypothetical protein